MVITYCLAALFFGMILGGFISGHTAIGIVGVVLFIVDVIISFILYRIKHKDEYARRSQWKNWNNLTFEEKWKYVREGRERVQQQMEKEGVNFEEEYQRLSAELERKNCDSHSSFQCVNESEADDFVVSEDDAEIIATLFRKGVSDYESLIKALKWDKKKQNQLFEYILYMGFFDHDELLLDDEFVPSMESFTIPEDKYGEFLQNLPIQWSDDYFNEEWYREAYKGLRDFLIRLSKENPGFKNKTLYSLDDVGTILGMTFCVLVQKPQDLCGNTIKAVQIRLQALGKREYTFTEVLRAFDGAFKENLQS